MSSEQVAGYVDALLPSVTKVVNTLADAADPAPELARKIDTATYVVGGIMAIVIGGIILYSLTRR